MNQYQKGDGSSTTADDPGREIWYGVGCHYWTDDWTKIPSAVGGLPVCPGCGSPGFQAVFKPWWEAAEKHEANGNPGYLEKLKSWKESCSKKEG